MIIFPQALILSSAAAGAPLYYPRICHQTYLRGLAPASATASSEATDCPKDAPLRPNTAEFWKPLALPAWLQFDLGAGRTVDYLGLIGKWFGAAVAARYSDSPTDFSSYLSQPGAAGNYASTPDTATNSPAGDVTVDWFGALVDYSPAAEQTLVAKWNVAGNQRALKLSVTTGGNLKLMTSANGSTDDSAQASSAVISASDGSIIGLRATRASASGNLNYFTSTDLGANWVALGTANRTSTAGAIFNSSAALEVGSHGAGASELATGRAILALLRTGIAGAVLNRFDPEEAAGDNALGWTATTGEVWTVAQSGGTPARIYRRLLGFGAAPPTDAPLLVLETPHDGRYLRLDLTGGGSVMPQVSVAYLGQALAMPRGLQVGFQPPTLSRDTVLRGTMSRGGQFVGRSIRRMGVHSNPSFRFLDETWYRAYFDPFVANARQFPYFFAPNAQQFPGEVTYAWTDKDITPSYATHNSLNVAWQLYGVGTL